MLYRCYFDVILFNCLINYIMAKVGRPLKFESVEELQEEIDHYFRTTDKIEVTITGLALALGTSRKVLMEYERKEKFSNTIKEAKTRVEMEYEKSLRKNGRAGDLFGLKNFGWRDKTEVDNNVKITDLAGLFKKKEDQKPVKQRPEKKEK